MKSLFACLLAAAGLAACGSGDGLSGCDSCHCDCGGATIDGSVGGMPICDCKAWCTSECHGTPASWRCVGPVTGAPACAN